VLKITWERVSEFIIAVT
jgi:hypothetical protein